MASVDDERLRRVIRRDRERLLQRLHAHAVGIVRDPDGAGWALRIYRAPGVAEPAPPTIELTDEEGAFEVPVVVKIAAPAALEGEGGR